MATFGEKKYTHSFCMYGYACVKVHIFNLSWQLVHLLYLLEKKGEWQTDKLTDSQSVDFSEVLFYIKLRKLAKVDHVGSRVPKRSFTSILSTRARISLCQPREHGFDSHGFDS